MISRCTWSQGLTSRPPSLPPPAPHAQRQRGRRAEPFTLSSQLLPRKHARQRLCSPRPSTPENHPGTPDPRLGLPSVSVQFSLAPPLPAQQPARSAAPRGRLCGRRVDPLSSPKGTPSFRGSAQRALALDKYYQVDGFVPNVTIFFFFTIFNVCYCEKQNTPVYFNLCSFAYL